MTAKTKDYTWVWVVAVIAIIVGGFMFYSASNDRRGGDGSCNNNYTGTCVPNVSNDIDCSDIRHKVTVVGKDVYHFDADADGSGCESYK